MDFIGSKIKLNKWLFESINEVSNPNSTVFVDGCCGSGAVSRYAAEQGYTVVANDLMELSRVVANGSIGLSKEQQDRANKFIDNFKNTVGIKEFFYKNFSQKGDIQRLYFTPENAMMIDRLRRDIESVRDNKVRDYLLYCGIEALSRVSNTAGTHGAFLKKIKSRANMPFELRIEKCVNGNVIAYSKNILELINDFDFRKQYTNHILYIDPPYNNRQYPPNYHLYETFVRNDKPNVNRKNTTTKKISITGLRPNWKSEGGSDFCNTKKCLAFLRQIVNTSTANYIFLSYSSDGLLKKEDIEKEFLEKITVTTMDQRRYKADTSDNRQYATSELIEYLFRIKLK